MRGVISPKLKYFIEQARAIAIEENKNGVQYSPELVRANIEKLADYLGEGPKLAYTKETALQTPKHDIPVKVYSPAPEQQLPVVLHYHGGGHLGGNIALYDAISRRIATAGHCIVIAVGFRLAPEYPYPEGIEDCQYALEHYTRLLKDLNFNQQLIIIGDSAGGAICSTLASNNLSHQRVKIDKQVLIYPSVDYTMSCDSINENAKGYLLEKEKIAWYFEQYFQGAKFQQIGSRRAVSPLFMPMNEKMPNTLIFVAGCDPLRDEAIAYGEALESVGGEVKVHLLDDMIHGYMLLNNLVLDECRQTYRLIGEFIRS